MKKALALSALLSAFTLSNAQEVDTPNYVTADVLSTMFSTIMNKIDALEARISELEEKLPANPNAPDKNGVVTKGHEYVDLGITDDDGKTIYWATCNVGAAAPEDYGYHIAWGETTVKSSFSWDNYAHCDGSFSTLTKYCTKSEYGIVDNTSVLDPEDDAAIANWGGSWHTPSYEDMDKLRTECYWESVTSYKGKSVNGFVVYKAKAAADKGKYSFDSPSLSATYSVASDTHIFLPGAADSYGYYWSTSIDTSVPYFGKCIYFYSYFLDWNSSARASGLAVRPVCK